MNLHESRSDLPVADREDYIKAVLCLQSKSPKAPSTTVPGARSRFDDFVATHIVNTPNIHGTVRIFTEFIQLTETHFT